MDVSELISKKPLYVLWCGPNEMSADRKSCLDTIYANSGCDVRLITEKNLSEYILPEAPLHLGYEYLSYTHRSDYLRAYLMHYHGGAYCDIKVLNENWAASFEHLKDEKTWAVGTPLPDKENVRHKDLRRGLNLDEELKGKGEPSPLYKFQVKYICSNAYIMKPRTPLTYAWFHQMTGRLDMLLEQLRKHPAQGPQDRFKLRPKNPVLRILNLGRSKYPLYWNDILGDIYYPLVYQYRDHINLELPSPDYDADYR
ncbi:MAG: capsular polysaccharide synthesis protein [Lentisphaeria bacterium]|nr:capsular polysaccharide synthesis protein [Lentisphaeria bacterium]